MLNSPLVQPSQPAAPPDTTKLSPAARILWTLLILATLGICYFSHLGALGFVGPDEPRYAWIARDMAESGDWVTPRLYGKPWFEKPVLYYWGAAASFKLFGVSETAARLPSAIAALLATLALAWLALRLYGAETARWLLLLLPTTVGMIGFSHAAATDMPFSATLTIAMVCASVILGLAPSVPGFAFADPEAAKQHAPILPRTPWLALLLFGFFLGLAVLAKGPAAIILSGGAVFFWALFTYRRRDAFRLLHPVAIASFCATALPWYILCARRNPDFFRVFIIEHNFKRFLTPEFQHIQPFWFYLPIALLALFPWTALLAGPIADASRAWKESRWRTSHALFFLCWACVTLVFFTISKSKLPGYILPAVPPLVLLIARSTATRLRSANPHRWIGITVGLTLLALCFGFFIAGLRIPFGVDYFPPNPLGLLFFSVGLCAVVACLLATMKKRMTALFLAISAFLAAVVFSLTGNAQWALDIGISRRTDAIFAGPEVAQFPDEPLFAYGFRRGDLYGLSFYLQREVREWNPKERLNGLILVRRSSKERLIQFGVDCSESAGFRSPIILCREKEHNNSSSDRR